MTFVLDGEAMAFTGDCLLIQGMQAAPISRRRSGDRCTVRCATRISSLPDECPLYPAHDYRGLTATSVAEERAFNARLGDGVERGARFSSPCEEHRARPRPKRDRCGGACERRNADLWKDMHRWPIPIGRRLTVHFFRYSGRSESHPGSRRMRATVQRLDVRGARRVCGTFGSHRWARPDPARNAAGPRLARCRRTSLFVAICRVGSALGAGRSDTA